MTELPSSRARGRGRPPIDDQLRIATVELTKRIREASRLTPAELEAVFHMSSTPPGNNWRRYERGDRTLSAEKRAQFVQIAQGRGWLPKQLPEVQSVDDWLSWGFVADQTFAQYKASIKEKEQRKRHIRKVVANCVSSIDEVLSCLDSLDVLEWHVPVVVDGMTSDKVAQARYEVLETLANAKDKLTSVIIDNEFDVHDLVP